ncbi:hypothetical protein [Niallia sp.]|uniref:hypothetical protein n=1 Tax=Niallia sp. TaxID=2837523 RepID=UPI00289AC1D2|nr:hypothetical protein [Niallia sp.]
MKILTVPSAKEEIRRLQHFIQVVESFEADTLERWIIKEYAFTSSIREVVLRGNKKGLKHNGADLDCDYVRSVIVANPKDELHKLIKGNYKIRLKGK